MVFGKISLFETKYDKEEYSLNSVQNNENADFKSLILGLYRLAQDLRSLEDTALHQNTNANSGIVIVGKGTLDQYGSKLVDLVDDLLSQPEMAISDGDSEVLKQRIADLQAEKSDLENQLAAAHAQLDGYKQQEQADLMNSFNQQMDANSSAAVSADQAQSASSEEVDDEPEVASDDNESAVSDSAEEPATSESDSADDDSEASSLNSLTDDDALSDDQSIVDGEIDGTIADDNSADVDNASAGLADDEPDAPATPDSDDKEAEGPAIGDETDGLFDDESDSADDSNDTTDATDVAGGVGDDDGVDTNLQMDGTDSLDFDDSAFPNE